ncbi:MAG: hypothetical protein JNJ59_22630 [Deltaproteobacteria bacterium]|nr:hypothetical protein [Deltaproteobacteria bacterium]
MATAVQFEAEKQNTNASQTPAKAAWADKAKSAIASLGLKERFEKVQENFQTVRGQVVKNVAEVQGQLNELKTKLDPKPAVAKVREALKLENLKALVAKNEQVAKVQKTAEKAVQDGVKLTHDVASAVEKLGVARLGDLQELAKLADVNGLKEAFESLSKKVDQLKKKVDGLGKGGKAANGAPAEGVAQETAE